MTSGKNTSSTNGKAEKAFFKLAWNQLNDKVGEYLEKYMDKELSIKEISMLASVLEQIQKGQSSSEKEEVDPLKGFIRAIRRAKKELNNGV